jgi:hypothetical protein
MESSDFQSFETNTPIGLFRGRIPKNWVQFDTEDKADMLAFTSTVECDSSGHCVVLICRDHGETPCTSAKSYALAFLCEFSEAVEDFRLNAAEELILNDVLCYRFKYQVQDEAELVAITAFVFHEDHRVLLVTFDYSASQTGRWESVVQQVAESFRFSHSNCEE